MQKRKAHNRHLKTQMGKKPPGVFQTLLGVVSNVKSTNSPHNIRKCIAFLTIKLNVNRKESIYFSVYCINLLSWLVFSYLFTSLIFYFIPVINYWQHKVLAMFYLSDHRK